MIHTRASRHIPALLDGTLEPLIEASVWEHVARCRRCRKHLAELEVAEALLRTLPARWLPAEPAPAADARLRSLAR